MADGQPPNQVTPPRCQAYFWSAEWQDGERDVDRDYSAGGGRVYHPKDIDDAIRWLESDDPDTTNG